MKEKLGRSASEHKQVHGEYMDSMEKMRADLNPAKLKSLEA